MRWRTAHNRRRVRDRKIRLARRRATKLLTYAKLYGGTVTGRTVSGFFRQGNEPRAVRILEVDFSNIEKRVLTTLKSKKKTLKRLLRKPYAAYRPPNFGGQALKAEEWARNFPEAMRASGWVYNKRMGYWHHPDHPGVTIAQ